MSRLSGRDGAGAAGGDAERVAAGVGGFIAAAVDGGARAPADADRAFATLAVRMGTARSRRTARRLTLAVAGCALVAGAAGFWTRARLADSGREPLTCTLNGGAPLAVGDIPPAATAVAAAEPVLSFSDGTRIQMTAQTRGRVVELGRHGARIALVDGKAHVQVVHRPDAQWLFEAGPFLINVHGTSFSFSWNAVESRFEVHMESGLVSVTGPLSGGEIFLRAGETLSVGLHDHQAAGAAPATPPAAASGPPPSERPPAAPASAEAPSRAAASRARPTDDWVTQLAEGHAAEIVADAEHRGVTRVLAESESEELAALADAARYQRNDGLARRALLAQRRRFPRSPRAADASFLLGRLDDEAPDGAEEALAWYDRYLAEAPRGAYVSEALGRKMMALERAHRRADAAAIASDYLERFPSGTYAHAAEALVRAP
jgi:TolA-binding protein